MTLFGQEHRVEPRAILNRVRPSRILAFGGQSRVTRVRIGIYGGVRNRGPCRVVGTGAHGAWAIASAVFGIDLVVI